jgi:hypothetical protein
MAEFTRVNGFGNYVAPTLYTTADLKAFLITIKDDSDTAVDLRTLDDGADEMVESIVRDLAPLMYTTKNDTSGQIHVIMHGNNVDATSLQIRVRQIAAGIQGHAVADNDSTVALGTAITVA